MTFANFLDLGVPQCQPKWKLINISGERDNKVMGQMCQAPQCDHRNKAAPQCASVCMCVLSRCQPQVNGHATTLLHVTSATAKHGMAIFDSVSDGALGH